MGWQMNAARAHLTNLLSFYQKTYPTHLHCDARHDAQGHVVAQAGNLLEEDDGPPRPGACGWEGAGVPRVHLWGWNSRHAGTGGSNTFPAGRQAAPAPAKPSVLPTRDRCGQIGIAQVAHAVPLVQGGQQHRGVPGGCGRQLVGEGGDVGGGDCLDGGRASSSRQEVSCASAMHALLQLSSGALLAWAQRRIVWLASGRHPAAAPRCSHALAIPIRSATRPGPQERTANAKGR